MKLLTADRKRMNDALHTLSSVRHPAIPLASIAQIIAPLTMEEFILCGSEGHATIELFKDDINLTNSWLVLYWSKGELTPTYEINAYLS
jgi:hypothetical protein